MLNSGRNIKPRPSAIASPSLPSGSFHSLKIEKLVAGGFGLGRLNRQVVLCAGALPGESVKVEIVGRRKGVAQGRIREIGQVADSRVAPLCPHVERCGGCQLQHAHYTEQLAQKRLILEDALRRIGKMADVSLAPVIPSPRPYGYRQVLRLGVGQGKDGLFLGFYEAGTQQLLSVETCFLVDDPVRGIIDSVRAKLRSARTDGLHIESVEIRWSQLEGGGLLIFRGHVQTKEQVEYLMKACVDVPHVKGLLFEFTDSSKQEEGFSKRQKPMVQGMDYFWEAYGELRLKIGFRSFMQANWEVFQLLGNTVVEWLGSVKGQRILELYAGTGPLGLRLAKRGGHVTCVEGNPFAVHDARDSIRENNISGCRVKISSVEAYLMTVQAGVYDAILLDPPRTGLNPKIIESLGTFHIPRLLYLSCDAPSLARDCQKLKEKGYMIRRMQPFDMFPQTAHLETLVEFVTV